MGGEREQVGMGMSVSMCTFVAAKDVYVASLMQGIESDYDCTADHRLNSTTVYRKLFDLVILVCDFDN